MAQSCLTLCDPIDYTVYGILQVRILEWVEILIGISSWDLTNPWIEPRSPALQVGSLQAEPQGMPKNTGVGSLSLLQRLFPTQELNWGLLHFRWILYQMGHKGCPRILEWVGFPFSRGSSRPRNRIGVSCIAGGFVTNCAIREALYGSKNPHNPIPPQKALSRHYT